MQPRVLVLRAPGTNCDYETSYAFEQAGGRAERVHINRLLENPRLAAEFQIFCIPGGFCYGDDLAAGRVLASQMRHHLADCMQSFRAADKLVLGICNGFQVLMQTGLLLQNDEVGPLATLTLNASARYEDRWVQVGVQGSKCIFLTGIEQMYLPVAHAEGQFVARDAQVLATLDSADQLVLRYRSQSESPQAGEVAYPDNPNGSMAHIAGICDSTGRVFGLMPHPERNIDPLHHPRWTRMEKGAVGDGLQIFKNAISYFS